VNTNF